MKSMFKKWTYLLTGGESERKVSFDAFADNVLKNDRQTPK